jgi:hypothetical protein
MASVVDGIKAAREAEAARAGSDGTTPVAAPLTSTRRLQGKGEKAEQRPI